ncbi:XRE family transcriptional regulator [Pseudochrobactrum saccharolyticum]|uniref:Transcriptional regulator with XRE-family HTH domain n=1 Tax=Pseudochrobactrum saccharolyticum TaxID=354352 RepID=A0A7W8AKA8_9HYPH|nr:XRE family transcriptional regulator [Pseudochrobactrum saccharolyticum]KAB0539320.1 XRE family transcriptional regulator [Pseudochrobactrum saccharolyticum]MBB5090638.1 transcriptional regulator with XRE-family HTH domain [Pseudochrobactrum saccharolyticum]MDP8249304.1 XRE family transcriptional regulator [Pseudochrobactrum saccharolyticum]
MITGPQSKAARALIELSRERLSSFSGIDIRVIELFERKLETPDETILVALQKALEDAGAVFIPENGGGIGVRLKFTRSEARRLSTLESEGGIVAYDEVP